MPHRPTPSLVLLLVACAVLAGCGSSGRAATRAASPRQAWRLVALGDSIPFGQHFCGYCATFDDLYAAHLRRTANVQVTVENLSQDTGITSSDLRREIDGLDPMRAAVASADIVTVSVGHNDTPWNSSTDPCDGRREAPNADWGAYRGGCLTAIAARYGRNLGGVLADIAALRAGKPTLVLVTDDYDDIIGDPTIPLSADAAVERVVGAFARTTCRVAAQKQATCIDTYHAFNGPSGRTDATPLLESDHTHPNEAGHRLIAQLLAAAPLGRLGRD